MMKGAWHAKQELTGATGQAMQRRRRLVRKALREGVSLGKDWHVSRPGARLAAGGPILG